MTLHRGAELFFAFVDVALGGAKHEVPRGTIEDGASTVTRSF